MLYNTKFILYNNKEVYPGYMDKEYREGLREQLVKVKGYMWCGCRSDQKLFYKISEDLKIYPAHNNYKHDKCCSRYRNASGESVRSTAYVINDEDGQVTTYLTFNPKNFDMGSNLEKDQDNPKDEGLETVEDDLILEKDEVVSSEKKERKEPKLSLPSLVRSINVDTFTEKTLNNKKIDLKDTFSKYVYHRMKKVKASRMKKAIGDFSLETDGVRFVYLPLAGIVKKLEKGLIKCYIQNIGPDGKIFNNFIFPETLEKALKEFVTTYGIEPDENTMLAGFQYYKKGRAKTMYKVLGRIHLFQISTLGIYSRSVLEMKTYDTLCGISERNKDLKFWIPPDDDSIGGIIQVENKIKKILLLFRGKKNERVQFDSTIYEPLVIGKDEPLVEESLYEMIEYLD